MRPPNKEELQSGNIGENYQSLIQENSTKHLDHLLTLRTKSRNICLKVNDNLEGDQSKVANHPANLFSTMADGIGGDYVNSCTESDFMNQTLFSIYRLILAREISINTTLNLKKLLVRNFEKS